MTTASLDLDRVRSRADLALSAVLHQQDESGAFSWHNAVGPASTAISHLVLDFLGYAPAGDTDKVANHLRTKQLPDGSFAANPDEATGDLASTAACRAALQSGGRPQDADAIARASAWIASNGGLEKVARSMTARAMLDNEVDPYNTAALLAFTGHLDAASIPALPLDYTAIPGIDRVLDKLVNLGVLFTEQSLAALIAALHHSDPGPLHGLKLRHIEELALMFQNPNGSWNNTVAQTLVPIAMFVATGRAKDDPIVARAARWVLGNRQVKDDEVWYLQFTSEVWDSGLVLRALLANGLPPAHPAVHATVAWFGQIHHHEKQPEILNAGKGVEDHGGLAFEASNKLLPDSDDTGLVMGALGLYLERAGQADADAELVGTISDAAAKNVAWLLTMQNRDGGWSSYSKNLPSKPRGSFLMRSPVNLLDPLGSIDSVRKLLVSLGDPSTADVTGRVLTALGRNGFGVDAPQVEAAIAFCFGQQLDDGSWWGRWMTNYLAGTAWVLIGFAAVGYSFDEPRVRRALRFIQAHQNPDGGWGETVKSYVDDSVKGQGPSMPGLTGTILTALLLGRQLDDPELGPVIERGIEYLLRAQNSDGTWNVDGWMHVYLLPRYFYSMPSQTLCPPLEALGRYLQARGGQLPLASGVTSESQARAASEFGDTAAPNVHVRDAAGRWSVAGLRARRQLGDPAADGLIRSIFAERRNAAVSAAFQVLMKSDDPIPADLDPSLRAWFEPSHGLPGWADPVQIARAQEVFMRHGWATAFGLFCSSLPQAYAAANGARVLMGTAGMTRNVRHRILETAQMLFDVLGPDSFGPEGRGIRACQKLRLMHAAIRHLTLQQGSWDAAAWGVPINQEDLAGTLLTFSSVILDVFDRLELEVNEGDQQAWMHLWCCVGSMLGLAEELLPRSRADAEALMNVIRVDQWASSSHGRHLVGYLIDATADYLPVPGAKKLVVSMIRATAGDWCAQILALPELGWSDALVDGAFTLDGFLHRGRGRGERSGLLAWMSQKLMQGVIDAQRLGKQTAFVVPTALRRAWNLEEGRPLPGVNS